MSLTTDIQTLGTEYSLLIERDTGSEVKKVRIIDVDELLEASLGTYDVKKHSSYSSYLEASVSVLSGFSTNFKWVCHDNDEVPLSVLVEYAVDSDVDIIILEYPDSFGTNGK